MKIYAKIQTVSMKWAISQLYFLKQLWLYIIQSKLLQKLSRVCRPPVEEVHVPQLLR